MTDSPVLIEKFDAIGLVRLNRPGVMNALSPEMLDALAAVLEQLDSDDQVRVIVLTGSARVFAAGADIKMMSTATSSDMVELDTWQYWRRMSTLEKPVIAAVSGYAFGGGCELAMQCDLIVASETAQFAQSEVRVGIMPGAGGTQRLTKAIGPYRAMEMVLTGDPISAEEARLYGLVNRVVPVERYLDEAIELARRIAKRPPVAVRLARQALRYGNETTLGDGLKLERRNFYRTFDTEDKSEGMRAFLEKRTPSYKGR